MKIILSGEFNGRFCKTPEYPNGIYAYFMPTNSAGNSTYPYLIGPSYYGVLDTTNVGPNSGKITITETVTTYFQSSSSITTITTKTSTTTSIPSGKISLKSFVFVY